MCTTDKCVARDMPPVLRWIVISACNPMACIVAANESVMHELFCLFVPVNHRVAGAEVCKRAKFERDRLGCSEGGKH